MTAAWDYFDKIYCISLSHRTDRREEAKRQFAAVGLSDKVEFFIVEKDSEDPERGCYDSHMACLRRGLDAGAELIAVFEDDILFGRFSPERLEQAASFCRRHGRFHMLFLGCLMESSRRTDYPGIRSISYRCLTHAYVVHRRFAEVVIRCSWQNVPYDDFLRSFPQSEMYALCPTFAFQSSSRTDNLKLKRLDVVRKLLGGLQQIQKMNEFYHRRRFLVIGAHVLALLFIGWALL